MNPQDLKPNIIVRGPMFPELVKVIRVVPMGGSIKLVGQAMILFAAGRGEWLRRFLVDDGVGKDQNFWSLAHSLCALYPSGTYERRWSEGVLARKKGLGL
jgi:hypothetical protein